MTTVRLAWGGGWGYLTREPAPALLVSYEYLAGFERHHDKLKYRDWVLDSGAFSAFTKGKTVELAKYVDDCKRLQLAHGARLSEVYALDVIGDWRAGLKNVEAMWKAGIEAIPCYHYGEPEDVLLALARDYPKIALGGCATMPAKVRASFAAQCFARVWPKKVHGFGFGSDACVLAAPFHSVDASSWSLRSLGYGSWRAYNGHVGVKGKDADLRPEIDWYLNLEQRARAKWRRELPLLERSAA